MANETSIGATVAGGLRNSPLLRLAAIGVLMLFLLIPISWISALIRERMVRRSEAVAEVSGKWGGVQTIVGPALVTPYVHRWTVREADGKDLVKSELRYVTMLPTELRVRARVDGEERYRGIFSVPVYRVVLEVSGEFEMPDLAALRIEPELVEWKRSALALGIADSRAIQNRASLVWNGAEHAFQPGPGTFEVPSGIHAPLEQPFVAPRPTFAFQLTLNGSAGLYFAPVGQQTSVTVDSNWPSPSFQGSWLPVERTAGPEGFRATWQIPFLGRNQEPIWTSVSSGMIDKLEDAAFGVDFVTPVDAHRMADRSVKYARLFVLLTFGTIWLIEVLTRVRVHPIQYLLIGCALCTFYLLELSLSEQFGFAVAYGLASGAVAILVSLYTAVVLHGWRRGLAVTLTVSALYAYLYVLLTNEDYALLLGSIGVFLAVAVTMLLTRHIDWYAPTRSAHVPDDAAFAPRGGG